MSDCTHANPDHLDTRVHESNTEVVTITTCTDCGNITSSHRVPKIRPSPPGTGGRPLPRRRKR